MHRWTPPQKEGVCLLFVSCFSFCRSSICCSFCLSLIHLSFIHSSVGCPFFVICWFIHHSLFIRSFLVYPFSTSFVQHPYGCLFVFVVFVCSSFVICQVIHALINRFGDTNFLRLKLFRVWKLFFFGNPILWLPIWGSLVSTTMSRYATIITLLLEYR